MLLGIEIGGTKLQLGVGAGDGTIVELVRRDVRAELGADGILRQVDEVGRELAARHAVRGVGFGFGGPVDAPRGRTIKSHQVAGWDDFPLADWCRQRFGVPVTLGNDCDAAGLAEARFGAGRGRRVVFFVTIGTGIGGGLVVDGQIYRGSGSVAAEIGHLRPGLDADRPDMTVEALAAGPAIEAAARARAIDAASDHLSATSPDDAADLAARCGDDLRRLSTKIVAEAAAAGNRIAQQAIGQACRALGWAIAQMATLVAPEIVVIGGGVSLVGEDLFFAPLRAEVARYTFPSLAGTFGVVPAALGESVVVQGAIALAAASASRVTSPAVRSERGLRPTDSG